MDRRSWLWRRKSSEKSPGETESSGSVSSISERYSDDQEALRASPVSASPNNVQSTNVSSKIVSHEVHETIKSLNEKLSAALFSISAKEDLVKQHVKVAEEAVAGWENAENEVAALKNQLEATAKKNSALEDRIGHLDGALKECVRQLRQSREDQQQKLQETLIKKTNEWESQKFELETRISELQAQLEARKAEATISVGHDFQLKLQALEKENSTLKVELLAAYEDLQMKTLERELSTRAAETASKQRLESIKKVTKLEAECRKLRAAAKRSSPFKDYKPLTNSVCVESLTDSQSDNGERLFGVDNELSCSDSWASTRITELDQFKGYRVLTKNLTSSLEIDLMDDFLEMERLAALPEDNHGGSSLELDADVNLSIATENPSKAEFEALRCKMGELEEKIEKMAIEKREVEMVLAETRHQLKVSCDQLIVAEDKLVELQLQLNSTNGSKHAFEMEVEALESQKKELESKLKATSLEVKNLREKVGFLEGKSAEFATKWNSTNGSKHAFEMEVEALESQKKELESKLKATSLEVKNLREKVGFLGGKSAEFATKCQNMEALTLKREQLEAQLMSAHLEVQKLQEKVELLEGKVEDERCLSAKLEAKCQNMEVIEAERMGLESKLVSAQLEAEELQGKISLLEGKLEEQRAISAEFTAKVEALEEHRETLRSQLEAANVEAGNLREKTRKLEKEVELERVLSAEFISKVESLEAKEETLSSLLESANSETEKLRERMGILEKEVKVERELSSEHAAKCKSLEALEAKKEEMESQLSSAHIEVGELCQKVGLLEGKVEEQRALRSQLESTHLEIRKLCEKVNFLEKEIDREREVSAEFAAMCQSLKDELVRTKREVEFQQPVSSPVELKIRQEREFAAAAGKLTECQKTIVSLSRQLKTLADFDLMLEVEEPPLDDKENFSSSLLPNGQEWGLRPSSASSPLLKFEKCLSPSRSYVQIQN